MTASGYVDPWKDRSIIDKLSILDDLRNRYSFHFSFFLVFPYFPYMTDPALK